MYKRGGEVEPNLERVYIQRENDYIDIAINETQVIFSRFGIENWQNNWIIDRKSNNSQLLISLNRAILYPLLELSKKKTQGNSTKTEE